MPSAIYHTDIRNGEEKNKTGHRWTSRAAITNDSARRLYLLLPYDAYLLSFSLHCQCCYTLRPTLPPNAASYLAHHVRAHSPQSSACLEQYAGLEAHRQEFDMWSPQPFATVLQAQASHCLPPA